MNIENDKGEKNKSVSNIDIKEIISRIKNNDMTEHELIECLEIKQLYVLSNAIIKILTLRITADNVIDKLENISQYIGTRYTFAENISIGHFAIAALYLIDTDNAIKKFKAIFEQADSEKQACINKAIIILKDLTKN